MGEIFHVRMRLLDDSVPVQPLVQREEVLRSERHVLSVHRVNPVGHLSRMESTRGRGTGGGAAGHARGRLDREG